MKPSTHICSSAILSGVVYALTASKQIAISAFVSGIFIDVDHIFDFLIFSGDRFSIKNFFSWCYERKWEKITVLFHSWELFLVLGVLAIVYPNHILIGFLLGGGLHLILDQTVNLKKNLQTKPVISPLFYFLIFRCFAGFQKNKMFASRQYQEDKIYSKHFEEKLIS